MRSDVGFTALKQLARQALTSLSGRPQLHWTEGATPTIRLSVQLPQQRQAVQLRSSGSPAYQASGQVTRAAAPPARMLELRRGDLFECVEAVQSGDILICETNISDAMQHDFLHFIAYCKPGARLLTYNSLEQMHHAVCAQIDMEQIQGRGLASSRQTLQHQSHLVPEIKSVGEKRLSRPQFPWQRMAINTPVSHTDISSC